MSQRGVIAGLLVLASLLVPLAVATPFAAPETAVVDSSVAAAGNGDSVAFSASAGRDAQNPLAISADRFDRTLFEITVYENRSATWRFQYTQRLANDTERTNFEAYATDFRDNETALYRQFVADARGLTRAGTNVTDREMNATGFSRDAYTDAFENLGIVELSFRWTNFAEADGDGVLVGDVFEGGLAIQDAQRLRFVAGPNLSFEAVAPSTANTSDPSLSGSSAIEWVGPATFADQRPRVLLVSSSVGTPGERTETTTSATGTTPFDSTIAGSDTTTTAAGGNGLDIGPIGVLLGLVVIAAVVVALTWQRGYLDVGDGGDSAAAADAGEPPDDTGGTPEATEAALLSDTERVRTLLEDNDGRMKQTAIVEATEWSKSKVSMLLSEMEADGEISKIRIGRENIVTLPGAEPDAAGSPFEDGDE